MNITTTQYPTNVNQTNRKTFEEQSILGKDDFLKIFITELQNQDPLDPLKDREFIAQMAQFTTLEQLTNLSKTNEKMLANQEGLIQGLQQLTTLLEMNQNPLSQYGALIGKTGAWLNNSNDEQTGIIDAVIRKESKYYAIINGGEIPIEQINKLE